MSEVQSGQGDVAKKRNPLRMVLAGVILVGVAAVLYVIATASFKPSGPADLREFKKGTLEKREHERESMQQQFQVELAHYREVKERADAQRKAADGK